MRHSHSSGTGATAGGSRRMALRFVLLIGVLSFFADFTYEGSRSILGPYTLMIGSNGLILPG
jgi:hypothetical protein